MAHDMDYEECIDHKKGKLCVSDYFSHARMLLGDQDKCMEPTFNLFKAENEDSAYTDVIGLNFKLEMDERVVVTYQPLIWVQLNMFSCPEPRIVLHGLLSVQTISLADLQQGKSGIIFEHTEFKRDFGPNIRQGDQFMYVIWSLSTPSYLHCFRLPTETPITIPVKIVFF
jgi:hypothetical protein